MKIIQQFFTILVISSFVSSTMAQTIPLEYSNPANTVVINSENLRTMVLKNNLTIEQAMNQVHQAKIQLNQARAQLLPGINIGLLNPFKPTFVLSAVSVLLPFLLPSNWFNLSKSKAMMQAEEASFQLVELNTFASIYAMFTTISGDYQIREALWQQYKDLQAIAYILEQQDRMTGAADPRDLAMSKAQAELARVQVSQMDELLIKERAALRHALALGLDVNIVIEPNLVVPSEYEGQDIIAVAKKSNEIAPEAVQIEYMMMAAKKDFWAKTFSFLGGASYYSAATAGRGGLESASFSNMAMTGTMNFSFGQVPMMELSNNNYEQLETRKKELTFQINQIVEASLGVLGEVNMQVDMAQSAEENYKKVYRIEMERYRLGINDITRVLYAKRDVGTATLTKIKCQVDLAQQRINLHRIMLTDQFSHIKGCYKKPSEQQKKEGFFKRLKNSMKSQPDLEKMCRGQ